MNIVRKNLPALLFSCGFHANIPLRLVPRTLWTSWRAFHTSLPNQAFTDIQLNDIKQSITDKEISSSKKQQQSNNQLIECVVEEMLAQTDIPNQEDFEHLNQEFGNMGRQYVMWPFQLLTSLSNRHPCDKRKALSFKLLDYANQKNVPAIALQVHTIVTLLTIGEAKHCEEGYKLYTDLKSKVDHLDDISTYLLIRALSKTKYWTDGYDLLIGQKKKGHRSYSVLKAALKHSDWQRASSVFDFLDKPTDDFFRLVFSTVQSQTAGYMMLNKMEENSWLVSSPESAELIKQWFDSQTTWQSSYAPFSPRGECSACGKKLPPLDIKQEDFAELRTSFMEKSVIGKDVFRNCHPLELKSFRKFLRAKPKPFDVVIDGLNVLYVLNQAKSDITKLQTVIEHFSKRGLSVLLIGRKHLHKTLKKKLPGLSRIASYFFISNISQDDQFLLYAALDSGIDTLVVTRDSFRDHIHIMGPTMGRTLDLWLTSHRVGFNGLANDKPSFVWPPPHEVKVHRAAGSYHIPYEIEDRPSNAPINHWLCVRSS